MPEAASYIGLILAFITFGLLWLSIGAHSARIKSVENVTKEVSLMVKEIQHSIVQIEQSIFTRDSNFNEAVVGANSDGIINQWSFGAEQLLGFTVDEAIGKNIADLIIPAEMREPHNKAIERLKTSSLDRTYHVINATTAMHKNGSRVLVSISAASARIGSQRTLTAIIYPLITDPRR